jgi:hypothetical protein
MYPQDSHPLGEPTKWDVLIFCDNPIKAAHIALRLREQLGRSVTVKVVHKTITPTVMVRGADREAVHAALSLYMRHGVLFYSEDES